MSVRVLRGDVLAMLATLPDDSISIELSEGYAKLSEARLRDRGTPLFDLELDAEEAMP